MPQDPDTRQPLLKLYVYTPFQNWLFRGQKRENAGGKMLFLSSISFLKFQAKIAFFWRFSKVVSRRSWLTRTTSDPTQLIRPRPINCDRVSEQPVKSLVFAHFFIWASPKTSFYRVTPDLITTTLKNPNAYSLDFRDRGLFSRDDGPKKQGRTIHNIHNTNTIQYNTY